MTKNICSPVTPQRQRLLGSAFDTHRKSYRLASDYWQCISRMHRYFVGPQFCCFVCATAAGQNSSQCLCHVWPAAVLPPGAKSWQESRRLYMWIVHNSWTVHLSPRIADIFRKLCPENENRLFCWRWDVTGASKPEWKTYFALVLNIFVFQISIQTVFPTFLIKSLMENVQILQRYMSYFFFGNLSDPGISWVRSLSLSQTFCWLNWCDSGSAGRA